MGILKGILCQEDFDFEGGNSSDGFVLLCSFWLRNFEMWLGNEGVPGRIV